MSQSILTSRSSDLDLRNASLPRSRSSLPNPRPRSRSRVRVAVQTCYLVDMDRRCRPSRLIGKLQLDGVGRLVGAERCPDGGCGWAVCESQEAEDVERHLVG